MGTEWLEVMGRAMHENNPAPLTRERQVSMIARFGLALAAAMAGEATMRDMQIIGGAANMSLLLCEYGLGEIEIAKAAQDACVSVWERHKALGRFVLTGPEIKALQALSIQHEAQLESDDCSERLLSAADRVIEKRRAAGHVVGAA
jgi:hypothetical protein